METVATLHTTRNCHERCCRLGGCTIERPTWPCAELVQSVRELFGASFCDVVGAETIASLPEVTWQQLIVKDSTGRPLVSCFHGYPAVRFISQVSSSYQVGLALQCLRSYGDGAPDEPFVLSISQLYFHSHPAFDQASATRYSRLKDIFVLSTDLFPAAGSAKPVLIGATDEKRRHIRDLLQGKVVSSPQHPGVTCRLISSM